MILRSADAGICYACMRHDFTLARSLFNGSVRLFQSIWSQLVTGWLCCSLRWGRGFIRMGEILSVYRYNIVLTFSKYSSITHLSNAVSSDEWVSPLEWTRCDVLKDSMLTAGLEEPTIGLVPAGIFNHYAAPLREKCKIIFTEYAMITKNLLQWPRLRHSNCVWCWYVNSAL